MNEPKLGAFSCLQCVRVKGVGEVDWETAYKRKCTSAEDAVSIVESGDTVVIPVGTEPWSLSDALMNRRNELRDVRVLIRLPRTDVGWFSKDLGQAFQVLADTQPGGPGAKAMKEKGIDMVPFLYKLRFKEQDELYRHGSKIDVLMVVISPPDKNGFCTFGPYLSHKKDYALRARKVLAEVYDTPVMNIKSFGDNYIHVSQIDRFITHAPQNIPSASPKPAAADDKIAAAVADLVHDGDTIELGIGTASLLPDIGAFSERQDLGIHSPIIGPELLGLVRRGNVTGVRKNIDTGKCVCAGFRRLRSEEDLAFVDGNPLLEVRNVSYVNDIRVIASHHRMVAINGVLAVDLNGQIAADSIGMRMLGGAGGQVDFGIGAVLSEGGRSIALVHSTTSNGAVSRIAPTFEPGTVVSIPWTFSDYVVSEYGVARLLGKSRRERAEQLISIAHPDFREELTQAARKMF